MVKMEMVNQRKAWVRRNREGELSHVFVKDVDTVLIGNDCVHIFRNNGANIDIWQDEIVGEGF